MILFFPLYWLLQPIFGADWGAGIAAFMMYIGFPCIFLLKWGTRSTHPFIRACNYGLAAIVLGLLAWVAYRVLFEGAPWPNGLGLIFVYGYLSIYFLRHGHMPYQAKEVDTGGKAEPDA